MLATEVVQVQACVGGVLAGDDQDAPRVPAHRCDGLPRPGQRGHHGDGVAGIERTEAAPRGPHLVGGQVVGQEVLQRRAQPLGHLLHREVDPELLADFGDFENYLKRIYGIRTP